MSIRNSFLLSVVNSFIGGLLLPSAVTLNHVGLLLYVAVLILSLLCDLSLFLAIFIHCCFFSSGDLPPIFVHS